MESWRKQEESDSVSVKFIPFVCCISMEVLERNLDLFIRVLEEQKFICCFLMEKRVFTLEDVEKVMWYEMKPAQNRALMNIIKERYEEVHHHFSEALERTSQFKLLQLIHPARMIERERVKGKYGKCKRCFTHEARMAFLPCRHVCTCLPCSNRKFCVVCKRKIKQKFLIILC